MGKVDAAIALFSGIVISALDGFIVNGPFLGLMGYAFSFFLGAVGWFAGTAIVHIIELGIDKKFKKHRRTLWIICLIGCCIGALIIVNYFIFFISEKASYSPSEIALHLLVLFLTTATTRATIYAAAIAAKG